MPRTKLPLSRRTIAEALFDRLTITRAAERAGMSLSSFRRRLREKGVERPWNAHMKSFWSKVNMALTVTGVDYERFRRDMLLYQDTCDEMEEA